MGMGTVNRELLAAASSELWATASRARGGGRPAGRSAAVGAGEGCAPRRGALRPSPSSVSPHSPSPSLSLSLFPTAAAVAARERWRAGLPSPRAPPAPPSPRASLAPAAAPLPSRGRRLRRRRIRRCRDRIRRGRSGERGGGARWRICRSAAGGRRRRPSMATTRRRQRRARGGQGSGGAPDPTSPLSRTRSARPVELYPIRRPDIAPWPDPTAGGLTGDVDRVPARGIAQLS